MMDEVTHTILPNNQWGGTALGAGVGGLLVVAGLETVVLAVSEIQSAVSI